MRDGVWGELEQVLLPLDDDDADDDERELDEYWCDLARRCSHEAALWCLCLLFDVDEELSEGEDEEAAQFICKESGLLISVVAILLVLLFV